MQEDTNLFWYRRPQHKVITVMTHTILHPQLDFIAITYIYDVPESVSNQTQEKKTYQDILFV